MTHPRDKFIQTEFEHHNPNLLNRETLLVKTSGRIKQSMDLTVLVLCACNRGRYSVLKTFEQNSCQKPYIITIVSEIDRYMYKYMYTEQHDIL